jgi:hypothetical protein
MWPVLPELWAWKQPWVCEQTVGAAIQRLRAQRHRHPLGRKQLFLVGESVSVPCSGAYPRAHSWGIATPQIAPERRPEQESPVWRGLEAGLLFIPTLH